MYINHYFAYTDITYPMDLYLYNYENGTTREILSWDPLEEQWWITGFNPKYVGKVDVKKQVMIGSVDFSKFTTVNGENVMYDSFKSNLQDDLKRKQYFYFDNLNCTIWLMWYEVGEK